MIPKRRKAPKMGVRAKPWWRSESYKQFIRGFECAVAGVKDTCEGRIEPAHVRTGTDGCGSEKPSDWWLIPLCKHHHIGVQHNIGEPEFERQYGINMKALSWTYWNRWPRRGEYGRPRQGQ